MRVLSLFSGIGGFDLGLERAGMEIIGQVEIDPYCQRILEKHWPGVARWDDVRGVDTVGLRAITHPRQDRPVDPRRRRQGRAEGNESGVDLICGGFPCQDLSVAGKRAGLDGERSGLWFEFQRIVSEVRPTYVLVENVPGLLSSNQGRDFAVVLNGLAELGYCVSWAVLDSRHFGVAQRRRRVFIVAGPDPESTEAILALSEGCAGHPETRRAAGEDVAGTLASRAGGSRTTDLDGHGAYVANPLGAKEQGWRGDDLDNETYVTVFDETQITSVGNYSNPKPGDPSHPLAPGARPPSIAFQQNTRDEVRLMGGDGRYAGALSAEPGMKQQNYIAGASVRRLTPVECARLQGFPDDWLDGADGPQYRALGNAVTVPVIEWIGRRIMAVAL